MEGNNINLDDNVNYDKLFSLKILLLYVVFASHIFILPNDILDKFPFLNSYVEFMKENFEIIKQISIRTTNFQQAGTLWGANMLIICCVFCVPLAYDFFVSAKCNSNFLLDSIRQEKLFFLSCYIIILLLIEYKFCSVAFSGDLFDTQIRLGKNTEAINSKFGLFFKGGALYALMSGWTAMCLTFTYFFINITFKKFKNLITKIQHKG